MDRHAIILQPTLSPHQHIIISSSYHTIEPVYRHLHDHVIISTYHHNNISLYHHIFVPSYHHHHLAFVAGRCLQPGWARARPALLSQRHADPAQWVIAPAFPPPKFRVPHGHKHFTDVWLVQPRWVCFWGSALKTSNTVVAHGRHLLGVFRCGGPGRQFVHASAGVQTRLIQCRSRRAAANQQACHSQLIHQCHAGRPREIQVGALEPRKGLTKVGGSTVAARS